MWIAVRFGEFLFWVWVLLICVPVGFGFNFKLIVLFRIDAVRGLLFAGRMIYASCCLEFTLGLVYFAICGHAA